MWWHSVPKCAQTTNCNLFCGPSAVPVLNALAVSIICTFLFIEMATKISFLYQFIVCIGYSAAVYCSCLSISLIPRIAHTHASPSCSCFTPCQWMTTIILLTSLWLLQLLQALLIFHTRGIVLLIQMGVGGGWQYDYDIHNVLRHVRPLHCRDKEWFGMTIWWFTLNSTFMVMIWLWLFYASISREHKNDNYTTTATNIDRVHDGQIGMATRRWTDGYEWWTAKQCSGFTQKLLSSAHRHYIIIILV